MAIDRCSMCGSSLLALAVCPLCDMAPACADPDAYRGAGSTGAPPMTTPSTPAVEIPPPPSLGDLRRD